MDKRMLKIMGIITMIIVFALAIYATVETITTATRLSGDVVFYYIGIKVIWVGLLLWLIYYTYKTIK